MNVRGANIAKLALMPQDCSPQTHFLTQRAARIIERVSPPPFCRTLLPAPILRPIRQSSRL